MRTQDEELIEQLTKQRNDARAEYQHFVQINAGLRLENDDLKGFANVLRGENKLFEAENTRMLELLRAAKNMMTATSDDSIAAATWLNKMLDLVEEIQAVIDAREGKE